MTKFDIIRGAREILSDPKRWTKGSWRFIDPDGEECYCLEGALGACVGEPLALLDSKGLTPELREADEFLRTRLPNSPLRPHRYLQSFNDDYMTTHEDILQFLDNALAEGTNE